jgi:hypothetical protein
MCVQKTIFYYNTVVAKLHPFFENIFSHLQFLCFAQKADMVFMQLEVTATHTLPAFFCVFYMTNGLIRAQICRKH